VNVPYRAVTECRICGSGRLEAYFDLGALPLVDSLLAPDAVDEPRAPLSVAFCRDCAHSQLRHAVDPELLFSEYPYHSSVSHTFRQHCWELGAEIRSLFSERPRLKCLDLASNDGCLLREFRELGFETLGVEPARNLAREANDNGIPTVNAFWGAGTAARVVDEYGRFDVVTATNVLAHVGDVHRFVAGVASVLRPGGVFVFEVPYMRNLLRETQFDTIMHEHQSYFLLRPLTELLERHGFVCAGVDEKTIHGGTIRVRAARRANDRSHDLDSGARALLERERDEGLWQPDAYRELEGRARRIREDFRALIARLRADGRTVAAYGASGKGNIFVNYSGLSTQEIRFIVDDTKDKQGKLYPGARIPIVASERLRIDRPDYLVLLAWNFAREIMERTSDFEDAGGRYIIAIPQVRVVTSRTALCEAIA
jgi:2-polyprenyl-3-methyl-5-hydroxy-6-metoxy-1,4-benzoquinol methylase